MEAGMRKLKVGELVLDFDLYPRASISTHHVGELRRAVETGAALPPIVIDKRSKRVADGFHRTRLYSSLYGDDHETEVVEKAYKNDGELFLDAIRYNAQHGLRMDTHDKTHCIIRAKALKVDSELLAGVLCIDPKRVGELRINRTAMSGNLTVPLKRTVKHMAGTQLTKPQVEANEKLSGMNQVFYVNQVITLIESDLLDTSDEELMNRLSRLSELIESLAVKA
jgi:hypothetical protein